MEDTYGPECVCLQCGHQWNVKSARLAEKHEKYLRRIMGENSQVKVPACDDMLYFDSYGIMFYSKNKYIFGIPYDQITQVLCQKQSGTVCGWLTIRHVGNERRVCPVTLEEAKKDRTTVIFDSPYAESYYEIYAVLNAIAEENRKSGIYSRTSDTL